MDKNFLKLFDDNNANYLMQILNSEAYETRFIGGAVRDCLINKDLKDIDFATTLLPNQVIEILQANNVKAIPTGIEFGTITAVLNSNHYEITTLREDVETDGRHALVQFSNNWQIDAKRRDFTINAMSVDINGNLYDYFNGLNDLKNKQVKFIGNAKLRIQEDYLRILRFFRFSSSYGTNDLDPESLKYCAELSSKLKNLSGERIQSEMLKILDSINNIEILKIMQNSNILKELIADHEFDFKDFSKLKNILNEFKLEQNSLVYLALLLKQIRNFNIEHFTKSWALSRKQKSFLSEMLKPKTDDIVKSIIIDNEDYILERIIVNSQLKIDELKKIEQEINEIKKQIFPIQGEDLINLGMKPDKNFGLILKKAKTLWIDSRFTITKDELITEIRKEII